jgi:hypothetical protein
VSASVSRVDLHAICAKKLLSVHGLATDEGGCDGEVWSQDKEIRERAFREPPEVGAPEQVGRRCREHTDDIDERDARVEVGRAQKPVTRRDGVRRFLLLLLYDKHATLPR